MAAGMAYAFEARENFQQLRFMAGTMAKICRHRRTKAPYLSRLNSANASDAAAGEYDGAMSCRLAALIRANAPCSPAKSVISEAIWGRWRGRGRGHPVHLSE